MNNVKPMHFAVMEDIEENFIHIAICVPNMVLKLRKSN